MQNGKDEWDEELAYSVQEVLNGLGFGLLDGAPAPRFKFQAAQFITGFKGRFA
jgi:hypothetical protein